MRIVVRVKLQMVQSQVSTIGENRITKIRNTCNSSCLLFRTSSTFVAIGEVIFFISFKIQRPHRPLHQN